MNAVHASDSHQAKHDGSGPSPAGPGRGPAASEDDDWIERVGTKIGRTLGRVLLLAAFAWFCFVLFSRGYFG